MLPITFELFRQGSNVDLVHVPGVGLGLYIVHKLLDLLQGSISVESTVGVGSTFRVQLPWALPHTMSAGDHFAASPRHAAMVTPLGRRAGSR